MGVVADAVAVAAVATAATAVCVVAESAAVAAVPAAIVAVAAVVVAEAVVLESAPVCVPASHAKSGQEPFAATVALTASGVTDAPKTGASASECEVTVRKPPPSTTPEAAAAVPAAVAAARAPVSGVADDVAAAPAAETVAPGCGHASDAPACAPATHAPSGQGLVAQIVALTAPVVMIAAKDLASSECERPERQPLASMTPWVELVCDSLESPQAPGGTGN